MNVKLKTIQSVTVAKAGWKKRLSETPLRVFSVTVQSLRTNTGYQYIGDATVTASNGQEFKPEDCAEIEGPPSPRGQEEFDLFDVFVDSSTDAAEFRISAWIRA